MDGKVAVTRGAYLDIMVLNRVGFVFGVPLDWDTAMSFLASEPEDIQHWLEMEEDDMQEVQQDHTLSNNRESEICLEIKEQIIDWIFEASTEGFLKTKIGALDLCYLTHDLVESSPHSDKKSEFVLGIFCGVAKLESLTQAPPAMLPRPEKIVDGDEEVVGIYHTLYPYLYPKGQDHSKVTIQVPSTQQLLAAIPENLAHLIRPLMDGERARIYTVRNDCECCS